MRKTALIVLFAAICSAVAAEPKFNWEFNGKDRPKINGFEENSGVLACRPEKPMFSSRFNYPLKAFTLEVRFKMETPPGNTRKQALVGLAFNSYRRGFFELRITPDSRLEAEFLLRSDDAKKVDKQFMISTGKVTFSNGGWHTVRIASESGKKAVIWVDGNPIVEKEDAFGWNDIAKKIPQDYPLFTFGCSNGGEKFDNYLHGKLKNVKIWEGVVPPPAVAEPEQDAASSLSDPNLVLSACEQVKLKVAEHETSTIGVFAPAEKKFQDAAATAALVLDEKHLTVSVNCPTPDGVKPDLTGKNGWSGDHIEFFFRPNSDTSAFYQYCVNLNGKTAFLRYHSAGVPDTTFRSVAVSKIEQLNDGFKVILEIPRTELEIAKAVPGSLAWGNLIREGRCAGGTNYWKNPGRNFSDPANFGKFIFGSRKEHLNAELDKIRKSPLDADGQKNAAAVASLIDRRGEEPGAWDTIQNALSGLRGAALRQALAGKPYLIHGSAPWNDRIEPTLLTTPLKSISLRSPAGGKIYSGFVFSNLSTRPFMGQIKFFSKPGMELQFNRGGDDFSRRFQFYTALPTQDSSQRIIYDALAPMTLGTLFRAAPGEHVPIWFEIDSNGLVPGKYNGFLAVKPAYSGFPTENIEFSLEISPIDLNKAPGKDLFHYSYLLNSEASFFDFYRSTRANIIYPAAVPGQSTMDIYPELDQNGNIVKTNWQDLDRLLSAAQKSWGRLDNSKILVFLAVNLPWTFKRHGKNQPVTYGTPAWDEGMLNFVRAYVEHCRQAFGIKPENIIFYPVDEPNGDAKIPGTKMNIAVHAAKVIRSAGTGCQLFINPDHHSSGEITIRNFEELSKTFDIITLYRPRITPEILAIAKKNGRELWCYHILSKTNPAVAYRLMGWQNFQDGLGSAIPFWHLEFHAGGDGFNSFDKSQNSKNTTDYGAVYADFNHVKIIPSRRMWAHILGFEEYRLASLCAGLIKNPADRIELDTLVRRAVSGDDETLDKARLELLTLAEKLQK